MGGQPYVGQLLLVGFNFNPVGWLFCQGQLVPISQQPALYNLLGTTFGGDGQNTFGLPDLRGRVPVHQGSAPGLGTYVMGQVAGTESVTLTVSTYPIHNHQFMAASQNSNANTPAGNAIGGGLAAFNASGSVAGQFVTQTISPAAGGGQPHENRQPLLAMNWIIAFEGIYPSQS
jgi:microcystin-dependent protein